MAKDAALAPKPADPYPIPDPGPIGLSAFAATTMMLSIFNAGLMDAGLKGVVLPVALIYGGATQVIVGVLELFRKNIFGATAFMSYGAFWIAYKGISDWTPAGDVNKAHAAGLFLLAFGIFTVGMTLITLRLNVGLAVTFSLLTITFILLTIGDFSGNATITHAGGYFGLITAVAAWYTGFVGIFNHTWGRQVLPNPSLAK